MGNHVGVRSPRPDSAQRIRVLKISPGKVEIPRAWPWTRVVWELGDRPVAGGATPHKHHQRRECEVIKHQP